MLQTRSVPIAGETSLETLASRLAQEHQAVRQSQRRPGLLARLNLCEQRLREAYHFFVAAPLEVQARSHAAEWLLDNFYLLERTVRQIREAMPPGYYRRLPELAQTAFQGFPRVYAIARAFTGEGRERLDLVQVERFLLAYQEITPLTIGELWALPTMLRLALIELLDGAFTTLLSAQRRATSAVDSAEVDIVVANCFLGLQTLARQDWKAFFDAVSRVEGILRQDPAGVYAHMDSATRDHYRHIIEEIARLSRKSEEDVAWSAISLAKQAEKDSWRRRRDGGTPRTGHVGYYLLVPQGREQLEARLGYRPRLSERFLRGLRRRALTAYLGGIAFLSTLFMVAFQTFGLSWGGRWYHLPVLALLTIVPALTIAVDLINWLVTHTVPPRLLPRLNFQQEGVPAECSTMVVIPCLITTPEEVKALLQQLELHYLGNADPRLGFALLTDFRDAPAPHMPEDEALLTQAREGIEALNRKYGGPHGGPFYLFHRARRWNASEGCWMGWERKRGKLVEFNRLLAGETTSYYLQVGNMAFLPAVRYVITLDADTILPPGTAARLIATLAHPLNRPEFDSQGKLVAGYTILQPRMEVQPTATARSRFARIFSGDSGVDLYSQLVSDVYQDLFAEGNYAGKGIYHVAAFQQTLEGRVPENALLSHDLFEGSHGRAALVSDVILYEDYPSHYLTYMYRLHRWVRGDWQLLPWLFRRVPHAGEGKVPNPLSLLARWKIFDNLRRSLLTPSVFLWLVTAWLWLPGATLGWTLLALSALATPVLTGLITLVRQRLRRAPLRSTLPSLRLALGRFLVSVSVLPYEAILLLDAILTTLHRLLISHRRLLQWTTCAHTIRLLGREARIGVVWRRMWGTALFALALTAWLGWARPAALEVVAPLIVSWVFSPYLVFWLGRPLRVTKKPLSQEQRRLLRRLARRTWFYFEHFVGPDDSWLPPDHFQEAPRGLVAHRTSPTNIGLYLTSALAACDLGYLGPLEFMLRLSSTFETMSRMERRRGHWLNWYDTRDLQPLAPRYISTVDSGNLAAALLVFGAGCADLAARPVLTWQRWQGFLNTLDVFAEVLRALPREEAAHKYAEATLDCLESIRQQVLGARAAPHTWAALLEDLLASRCAEVGGLLARLTEEGALFLPVEMLGELRDWSALTRYHLERMGKDIEMFLPWLLPARQPPAEIAALLATPPFDALWQEVQAALPPLLALSEIPQACKTARAHLQVLEASLMKQGEQAARAWCNRFAQALYDAQLNANNVIAGLQRLQEQAETFFREMDFEFLYDRAARVFHLGYHVDSESLDSNHYDLLASEARLASLIAIARGDAPQEHWLHLGRPLTRIGGQRLLLSWGGTMFEYLMPALFAHHYEGSLLHQTAEAAVRRQIEYARQRGVPWGISESAYYRFDAAMNYQYRGFGTPGLGLRPDLERDLVVTPYASLLALSFQPQAVCQNIERLQRMGMLGEYGFYEAVDFTARRLPPGQDRAIVRSYMAHHQGMILAALDNALCEDSMIRRFHSDRRIQSVSLLLQEEMSPWTPLEVLPSRPRILPVLRWEAGIEIAPWEVPVEAPLPQVHLLSNGRYSVVVTQRGSGFSLWNGLALTRWQPDTALDGWGMWLYIQDRNTGKLWSATWQPTATRPASQHVHFHPHMAEFGRRDGDLSSRLEITVSPDDDAEIRRLTLVNHDSRPRRLRLVSYAEVVLGLAEADERHPAFHKLFVESEFLPELGALLFHRRRRAESEPEGYLVHLLIHESGGDVPLIWECDRARFLGRGRTSRAPQALQGAGSSLSGTTGFTLDPVMALGCEIELPPYATWRLAFVTLAAASRAEALELARRYRQWVWLERAFTRARYTAEVALQRQGFPTSELQRAERLLSLLLYPHHALRPAPSVLAANQKGQSGLWAWGISGDYPILLARVYEVEDTALLQFLLKAHTYWRERQIKVDLVILHEQETSYEQSEEGVVHRLLARQGSDLWLNRPGGIFILRRDQLRQSDLVLLQSAARLILDSRRPLEEQLKVADRLEPTLPIFLPLPSSPIRPEPVPPLRRPDNLLFENGLGGFSADGREYCIFLEPGQHTPAPWVNVMANAGFGCLVSESGGGFTWAGNSSENRLTPWRNDPVTDIPGEAIYLRDEETADIWSPTPAPAGEKMPYLIRHGAGYSIFEHHSHGLKQQVCIFVVPDAPVKVIRLRLENLWSRPRRITATFYVEWVLGTTRQRTQPYIVPEFAVEPVALLARNPYNEEFGQWVAFAAASKMLHGLTTDRAEFLGLGGTRTRPAALERIGLAGTVQAGRDPCAALQLHFDLPPGGSEEVHFLLGQGQNRDHALQLVARYQEAGQVEAAWRAVQALWDDLLGRVQVKTPDLGMNLMLNRWLLYQTLACRVWGRSALYQSSGAFGFRDQLQDVLALLHAAPDLVRRHILQAARHQFEEGDVLHWWHPTPAEANVLAWPATATNNTAPPLPETVPATERARGVRTRCSDDLFWLPLVTAQYVHTSGDVTILQENVPFLRGEPLNEGEGERYAQYEYGPAAPLYQHCLRALERIATGPHGLPLIGSGDWNDGLNRLGLQGRGESVWLGWFLGATLNAFADLCERLGEGAQAARLRQRAEALRAALEAGAWDGHWYCRAYDDDGLPLGAAANHECQIDSLAQSWAALSGLADPTRTVQALEAAWRHLVREEERLVLLFTPPFDKERRQIGYIQAYPPGVRENGGQYTHAAVWLAWAFAQQGDGDRAFRLFHLLNPIFHGSTEKRALRYRLEPYLVAADIYSVPPHVGRGGWSGYTGSAAWLYRLGIEAILGVRRSGDFLELHPCIPRDWPAYEVTWREGATVYHILVENPHHLCRGRAQVWVDGQRRSDGRVPLVRDGLLHAVRVVLEPDVV